MLEALAPAFPEAAWKGAPTPRSNVAESEGLPLFGLANSDLAGRYSHWLGTSGKRYLFSVYDPATCPAYCDAVLVVAKVDAFGRRAIIAIEDTGDFPDPAVCRAAQAAKRAGERAELHLHLLATTRAARREAIADLVGYASPARN